MCNGEHVLFNVKKKEKEYVVYQEGKRIGKSQNAIWRYKHKKNCHPDYKNYEPIIYLGCPSIGIPLEKKKETYEVILYKGKESKAKKRLGKRDRVVMSSYPENNVEVGQDVLVVLTYKSKVASFGSIVLFLGKYFKLKKILKFNKEERVEQGRDLDFPTGIELTHPAGSDEEHHLYFLLETLGNLPDKGELPIKAIYEPNGDKIDTALINIQINKAHDPLKIISYTSKVHSSLLKKPQKLTFKVTATNDGPVKSYAKKSTLTIKLPKGLEMDSLQIDSVFFGGNNLITNDWNILPNEDENSRLVTIVFENFSLRSIKEKKIKRKNRALAEGIAYFSIYTTKDIEYKKIKIGVENYFDDQDQDIDKDKTKIKVPLQFGIHPRVSWQSAQVENLLKFDENDFSLGLGVGIAPKNPGILRLYSEVGFDFGFERFISNDQVVDNFFFTSNTLMRTNLSSFLNVGVGFQLFEYTIDKNSINYFSRFLGAVNLGLIKKGPSVEFIYAYPIQRPTSMLRSNNQEFGLRLTWRFP